MHGWLKEGLTYLESWLEFQVRTSGQPGSILAVAHEGDLVMERAFGVSDLSTGEKLTPRHKFRVASHSKTFTATGIMLLRERGKIKLDDCVSLYIPDLPPEVAATTIGQLLSHSSGLTRDGKAGGQFSDHRPFAVTKDVLNDISGPLTIEPNSRFKYSNHGYALLGMVITAITEEAYLSWIKREVVEAFGLFETEPDTPLLDGALFAKGHTEKHPFDERLVVPGDYQTNAIAPAGGFISTAADLVRFFSQLSPKAASSSLAVASRREMTRAMWKNPDAGYEMHYGYGTISGKVGGWEWFGHSGALLGYISRTCTIPEHHLTISILVNSVDGPAWPWLDGAIHIFRAMASCGSSSEKVIDWSGRWWSPWGAIDLLPAGEKVILARPSRFNPLQDLEEIEITGSDVGRVVRADGYGFYGEPVHLVRGKSGKPIEFWLGSNRLVREAAYATEMKRKYA